MHDHANRLDWSAMSHLASATGDTCPLMPTYRAPSVQFVSGAGSWLQDATGSRYLDLLCGLAVTSLGHAHPRISEALAQQANKLTHVSNLFANEHHGPLAEQISQLIGSAGQTFFCNSGAEANECAIKLARKFGGRGRHVVLSSFGSFHGRTLATLHATGQPSKHEPFMPMPDGFRHASWNDAVSFEAALDPSVAAILIEPIQGEGGVNPGDREFFQNLRRLCDERQMLLMVDEVQTGFGRCGEWFGFQRYGIEPDVITMAKALGNGFPIGACWARHEVAAVFEPGDHGSTFGGQPLAAATARAVLDELVRIDAPQLARQIEALVRHDLDGAPGLRQIRGAGALLGLELAAPVAGPVCELLLANGVIANAVTADTIRIAPPLNIDPADLMAGLSTLRSAIATRTQEET